MRIIAAYLLAVLGGTHNPDKAKIKSILDSVGIKGDDERIDLVIKELGGKDLDDLIKAGRSKLAAVPSGGGDGSGGGGASSSAASSGGGDSGAKTEEEKKEDVDEPVDMGFSLFD